MTELTLDQANALIAAVLAEAAPARPAADRRRGTRQRRTPQALQRQDGCRSCVPTSVQAKAWGATGAGHDTRDLASVSARTCSSRGFMQALNAMSSGRIVPLPSGVLIRDSGGRIVGAIGVAGAKSSRTRPCAGGGARPRPAGRT